MLLALHTACIYLLLLSTLVLRHNLPRLISTQMDLLHILQYQVSTKSQRTSLYHSHLDP
jgi:hypothetical protein